MIFNIVALLSLAAIALWPDEAFAYIDPGTGSILIQGLIGAIAALGVTLKLYWHRFVAIFQRESTQASPTTNPAGEEQSESE